MNRLPFFDRPDDSLLRNATRIKIDLMRDGEQSQLVRYCAHLESGVERQDNVATI